MNYVAGFHAVEALLRTEPSCIIELLVVAARQDSRIDAILRLAQAQSVLIQRSSRSELDQLVTEGVAHQGVIAKHRGFVGFTEAGLLEILKHTPSPALLLVLDGVQDPHNLGSCLRTANGFGVHAVVAPKDRACALTPVVHKVSCGAASTTPFIQVTNLSRTLKNLQQQGVWIVGMIGTAESRITEIDLRVPTALVLGNEGQGIRKLTMAQCDYLARIPITGNVSSFNVAVATAISLYEADRQRNQVQQ